jgi:hypothetical protein
MIFAKPRCNTFKAAPGVKTKLPTGAKRCKDSSKSNLFSCLNDHADINGGCNSDASTLYGNPTATKRCIAIQISGHMPKKQRCVKKETKA